MESKVKNLIDDVVWDEKEPDVFSALDNIFRDTLLSMVGPPGSYYDNLLIWAEKQCKVHQGKASFMAKKQYSCESSQSEGINVLYNHHMKIAVRYCLVSKRLSFIK